MARSSDEQVSMMDLSKRIDDLCIDHDALDGTSNSAAPVVEEKAVVSAFEALLELCGQTSVPSFSSIFSSPAFSSLFENPAAPPTIRKIGEASYSEVYSFCHDGMDARVVKVIPLQGSPAVGGTLTDDIPDCSEEKDVLRELEITKRMSQVPGGGFIEFYG
jgi:serine/threonine-protein kinase haspin